MTTAVEPVYQALCSSGFSEEPFEELAFSTRPCLPEEHPFLTVYNGTQEEHAIMEARLGGVFMHFPAKAKAIPTAKVLHAAFQEKPGNEEVSRVLRSIGVGL